MNPTVLVIEDELAVREAVKFHLERAGFTVRAVDNATAGWEALEGALWSSTGCCRTNPDSPG
jgi:DNA-binding response OmpR family regulator